jgi:Flp pilus assembly protein CpaB
MLLQNVTVLAVGDSFAGGVPGFGKSRGGQLTLSLTLQEAQLVMFAEQQGELGSVLRRDGNIAAIEQDQLGRVSFKDLEDRIGVLDEERENRRIIKIRQGDVEESVPVKGN